MPNGNAMPSTPVRAGPSGSASSRRCRVRRAQRGRGLTKIHHVPSLARSLAHSPPPSPRAALARSSRGFDIHAGVSVSPHDREARERLLRYCARPPLSLERLSVLADGRVAYRIKNPRGYQNAPRDEPGSVFVATLRPHPTPASSARALPRRLRSALVLATRRRGSRARELACQRGGQDPSLPQRGGRRPPLEQRRPPAVAGAGRKWWTCCERRPRPGRNLPGRRDHRRARHAHRLDDWTTLKRVHDVAALACRCGSAPSYVSTAFYSQYSLILLRSSALFSLASASLLPLAAGVPAELVWLSFGPRLPAFFVATWTSSPTASGSTTKSCTACAAFCRSTPRGCWRSARTSPGSR
jgi:Putative transposase